MDDEDDEFSPPHADGSPQTQCEYCGAQIETEDWYPITKRRGSDGSLQLFPFCDEACQTAWLEAHPE